MRIVNYVDKEGYLRTAMIKEEDPDSMAEYGIPVEVPDLNMLDWDGFRRDLHNALTQAEFYSFQDVMKAANAFAPAVTVLKRYLTDLYMKSETSETTQD